MSDKPIPPEQLDGVTTIDSKQARKLQKEGALMVACYTHMTDWMEKRPKGAIHVTMDVPSDHKRPDMPLEWAKFDVSALPKDKNTPMVMFCADIYCFKSFHACRKALEAGYTNLYRMKDGIKGWQANFFEVETESKLLNDVMELNQANPATWVIDAAKIPALKNANILDIRTADQFAAGHIDGAINIPYAELWTFKNLEKLNKSEDQVIVYDDPIVLGAFCMSLRLLGYNAFILKN